MSVVPAATWAAARRDTRRDLLARLRLSLLVFGIVRLRTLKF